MSQTVDQGERLCVLDLVEASIGSAVGCVEHAVQSGQRERFGAIDIAVAVAIEALERHHGRRLLEAVRLRIPSADFSTVFRAMQTLEESYRDCETALLYWTGPYVLSQGDFAPWNIRNLGSQLFVTDWGHAHADASPLDDVLHYLMIQRALNSRPVTVPVLRQAMRRAADFAVQAYPEWSWRAPVIGALTLVYLLGVVLHRSLARRRIDRVDRVVSAYWKLLEKRSAWMPK